MTADMSIWSLFTNASLLVKLIMVGLLMLSLTSWTLIFRKFWDLRKTRRHLAEFEEQFWSGAELSKLFESLAARGQHLSGLPAVFYTGFREFVRLRKQHNLQTGLLLDGVARSMRVVLSKEADKLQAHLSFLATVGSVSPFIGLFGTVWGIMHSFIALGGAKQATIAMVAPGIAEALVATAMGLFVAIPAVIAYNRFTNSSSLVINSYENFHDEFTGILQRQLHASGSAQLAGRAQGAN